MFNVFKLNTDVLAVYQSSESGSDVLIFRRNEGLLGRVSVQERGDALEHRLERSFRPNRREELHCSAMRLVQRLNINTFYRLALPLLPPFLSSSLRFT